MAGACRLIRSVGIFTNESTCFGATDVDVDVDVEVEVDVDVAR